MNGKQPLFDEKMQTPQMKALKAVIPYMEAQAGKRAALAVKLIEIKTIMETFESDIAVQASDAEKETLIIEALRPFYGEQMDKMAGLIKKAEEMMKTFEMMKAMNSAAYGFGEDGNERVKHGGVF